MWYIAVSGTNAFHDLFWTGRGLSDPAFYACDHSLLHVSGIQTVWQEADQRGRKLWHRDGAATVS